MIVVTTFFWISNRTSIFLGANRSHGNFLPCEVLGRGVQDDLIPRCLVRPRGRSGLLGFSIPQQAPLNWNLCETMWNYVKTMWNYVKTMWNYVKLCETGWFKGRKTDSNVPSQPIMDCWSVKLPLKHREATLLHASETRSNKNSQKFRSSRKRRKGWMTQNGNLDLHGFTMFYFSHLAGLPSVLLVSIDSLP